MLRVVDAVGGVGTVMALDAPFELWFGAARCGRVRSQRRHQREGERRGAVMRDATVARWEGVGGRRAPR